MFFGSKLQDIPQARILDCPISDETAMIKAKRYMEQLKEYGSESNWYAVSKQYGLDINSTPSKQWKAILRLANTRKDARYLCFDAKGVQVAPTAKKKIRMVTSLNLASDEYFEGVHLIYLRWHRSLTLRPRLDTPPFDAVPILKITLHSLQRIFQRGYGITKDGELDYLHLTDVLIDVFAEAFEEKTNGNADNKIIVDIDSARCVVVCEELPPASPMTLVTVLPVRK